MSTLELHPLCTLFPRLEGADFGALKADIAAHGLREPIVVHAGFILDGGNRYRACVEAGVEPTLKEFTGDNPVSFVLSANLHRRHLTPGQQAAIVSSAQDWANAQPAHRPEKGGNVAGLSTVADRAAQSGASERTQRMADSVARQSPDLARQVAHGKISLPKALEQLADTAQPTAVASTGSHIGTPAHAAAAPSAPHEDIPNLGVSNDVLPPSASFDRFMDSLDDGHVPDLEDVNRELEAKNAALEAEIVALKLEVARLGGTDQAARIEALCLERDGAYSLAASHRSDFLKANKTVVDYTKLLARLRRAAGVERDSEIRDCIVRRSGAA